MKLRLGFLLSILVPAMALPALSWDRIDACFKLDSFEEMRGCLTALADSENISDDELYEAFLARGDVELWMDDYFRAQLDGVLALALMPDRWEGFSLMARADAGLGVDSQALKNELHAQKLRPKLDGGSNEDLSYSWAVSWSFVCHRYVNLGMLDDALASCNKALSIRHFGEALEFRGRVWFGMADYERSVEDFTDAIETGAEILKRDYGESNYDPAISASWYLLRAKSYEKLGMTDKAESDVRQALKGTEYLEDDEIEDARQTLERILALR